MASPPSVDASGAASPTAAALLARLQAPSAASSAPRKPRGGWRPRGDPGLADLDHAPQALATDIDGYFAEGCDVLADDSVSVASVDDVLPSDLSAWDGDGYDSDEPEYEPFQITNEQYATIIIGLVPLVMRMLGRKVMMTQLQRLVAWLAWRA